MAGKKAVQAQVAESLDQSNVWRLKVFLVFPLLARMRNLDHYSRVMLPSVYAAYVIAKLTEVDFGRSAYGAGSEHCP